MWEGTERIDVRATPERVWVVVADIEGHTALAGSGEVKAIRMHGPLAAGTTFEGDIATGEVGSFVSNNRLDVVDRPRELSWSSYPPLDEGETGDHQIEVCWSFRLAPTGLGTTVEHAFSVKKPRAGAEQFADFIQPDRSGRHRPRGHAPDAAERQGPGRGGSALTR